MNAISHRQLGHHLADTYMTYTPRRYRAAFLIGCVEPDKNPTTYLKGSIRNKWLRGHNWESASRYIRRICRRLERKETLRLHDYYNLGKLIHYTADAFTYTHNRGFGAGLLAHRQYEKRLHTYFSFYLANASVIQRHLSGTVMETIRDYHNAYVLDSIGIHTDASYTATVCTAVICRLLQAAPQAA